MKRVAVVAALALFGLWTVPAHAATWCGAPTDKDQAPQIVPGPSIHVIYAIPSDGVDRLAELGSVIQTDIETIDGWWRGQDPSRTPRFDLFAFSCGAQLDISDVRLAASGAELTSSASRFSHIAGELASRGFTSTFVKYLVYYDGPGDGTSICGQGGGAFDGIGVAIVYLAGCAPEPTSVTAAHELTHSLGAVPTGAPHNCPPPNAGHVCDAQNDLMYPVGYGDSLSALVLDVNRDDYYGLAGGGIDIRNSHWLRHLDQPSAHLSVMIQGGPGRVDSDVPGVSCAASCSSDWDSGTTVGLNPVPPPGRRFVRWSGGCIGAGTCLLTMNAATTVTALFAPSAYPLTISVTGRGGVLSGASAALCKKRCRLSSPSFVPVALRAVPDTGWRFVRWSGSCRGTRSMCTLPMTAASTANAVFAKKQR